MKWGCMRIKSKKECTKSKVLITSKNYNKVAQFFCSNIRIFYEKSLSENKKCTEKIVIFKTKKHVPHILSYDMIKYSRCEYFVLFLRKYFVVISEINSFLISFLSNFKFLQELVNIGLKFNNLSREECENYIEEKSYQINTLFKTKSMIRKRIMRNELEKVLFSNIY